MCGCCVGCGRRMEKYVWVLCLLGVDEKSILRLKSGGTPNPRVKKLGVTPNFHKLFASAGARAAEAGCGAKRHGRPEPRERWPTRTNLWDLGVTPNFLTRGSGVPPLFLTKNRLFVDP